MLILSKPQGYFHLLFTCMWIIISNQKVHELDIKNILKCLDDRNGPRKQQKVNKQGIGQIYYTTSWIVCIHHNTPWLLHIFFNQLVVTRNAKPVRGCCVMQKKIEKDHIVQAVISVETSIYRSWNTFRIPSYKAWIYF